MNALAGLSRMLNCQKKINPLDIHNVVESAFISGYVIANKECSEKIKELEVFKWKYEDLNK